jgi:predicted alpha/beta superfamily hydrolase
MLRSAALTLTALLAVPLVGAALSTVPVPPSGGAAVCALPVPAEAFTLQSAVLGETRRLNVYTPPDYATSSQLRYPVLYVPDGGLEEDFGHVVDAVHAGISWGILRPLIVVGVENTERRRDMTGPTRVAKDREIAPRVGGSAAFRGFFRDELLPWVRGRYRTTEETAIIGESLAGLFVVETFLLEPGLFRAYVAIDPSLWWDGESLVRDAALRLPAMAAAGRTLYLTTANVEQLVGGVERLAAALRAHPPAGLEWQYHPMPDQFHDTIYRASAPRALRTLFAAAP